MPRLVLAALGIVFGDIGTSPIYALRECFFGANPVPATADDVLGVLSLIVWSLLLVISVKYLLFIMRADNKGEGGIVALVALLNPWRAHRRSGRYLLMLLGLFGGALLYGDGTITPAISVLSAIEGLKVATPAFEPYVIPLTIAILVGLFLLQKRGTGGIGALFGPVICLWLLTLAALGVRGILMHPGVLRALNPWYAIEFFRHRGGAGFLMLGAVFLVVTGGEALYADMGHFGRRPIRLGWFLLVLPSLLLNYFGQGALILASPQAVHQPFYQLAPGLAIYPLVALAAAATIIASQAVISGAFSLTRQLVTLGQLPRMNIVQTSSEEHGQIYVPSVNWFLMLATIGLVLGFKSSDALAAAYGIAVSATMVITTVLAYFVARRFGWNALFTAVVCAAFLVVDLTFLGANLAKIADGGWYPIGVAVLVFVLMTTWSRGRALLRQQLGQDAESFDMLVKRLQQDPPHCIPGTAVFLTGEDRAPARLMHHLKRHRVLQEHLLLLTVEILDVPRVPANERMALYGVAPGVNRIVVRYGFMQQPNVPVALKLAERLGLDIDLDHVTYYVGRETPIPDQEIPGMALWRERLFSLLSRNARPATAFYGLPPEDVVELGFQVRI
ncbi:MAG: KUP/HAK/KT family potassium transporter [Gammaproteobacteria bacterium]|nr:KUP/HAK/KT family potassium transporter [Gammaproteobacteria bacterium]